MSKYIFTPEQTCLRNVAEFTWTQRESAKRCGLDFGEETITEIILLKLAKTFPGDLTIVPLNKRQEGKVGADWAWAFQNEDRSHTQPMLVQAKSLDVAEQVYTGINQTVGGSKDRQIDLLIQSAEDLGWPPIYAFYNHLSNIGRIPASCQTLQQLHGTAKIYPWGVSVADSYRVRAFPNDLTFDTHRVHSLPLHCLLCCGATGMRSPGGSPAMVLESLHRLRTKLGTEHIADDAPRLPKRPMTEEPFLFRTARQIFDTQDQEKRTQLREALAKEFRKIAGVVIFRDKESI